MVARIRIKRIIINKAFVRPMKICQGPKLISKQTRLKPLVKERESLQAAGFQLSTKARTRTERANDNKPSQNHSRAWICGLQQTIQIKTCACLCELNTTKPYQDPRLHMQKTKSKACASLCGYPSVKHAPIIVSSKYHELHQHPRAPSLGSCPSSASVTTRLFGY